MKSGMRRRECHHHLPIAFHSLIGPPPLMPLLPFPPPRGARRSLLSPVPLLHLLVLQFAAKLKQTRKSTSWKRSHSFDKSVKGKVNSKWLSCRLPDAGSEQQQKFNTRWNRKRRLDCWWLCSFYTKRNLLWLKTLLCLKWIVLSLKGTLLTFLLLTWNRAILAQPKMRTSQNGVQSLVQLM